MTIARNPALLDGLQQQGSYSITTSGNYKQAIEDYDRAIEIKPDLAEAYYDQG